VYKKIIKKIKDMEKIVVGIDVGTTKIAVFIGQRDAEGKISIIGMGKTESDGVERGVVKNITLTANAIKLAVEQAEAMANYQVRDVYVGIAGHHIKSLHHRGNIMIPEDNHIITIQV
jgi:cell division protein FtsA